MAAEKSLRNLCTLHAGRASLLLDTYWRTHFRLLDVDELVGLEGEAPAGVGQDVGHGLGNVGA